ncbi:hypothetical protein M8494_04505 [Serratia ureilytica]
MDEEAEAIIAKDRESSQRDLFDAIKRGDFRAGSCKFRSCQNTKPRRRHTTRSI